MKPAGEARIPTAAAAPAIPAWKTWTAVAFLVAAVCIAYANSFHGPFIFDDAPSIIENQSIRHLASLQVLAPPPASLATTGRPIVNLSLAINYAMGGLAVEGYHVVNLVIHLLAALVLFALVRRTLLLPTLSAQFGRSATELALAVAALWALHPLQTESVTYVVQRAEAMVGLFYLLTLYSLVRGATAVRGKAWYAAAVGACALGMASKEVMATAPVVAVLFARTFIAGSFKESLRRRRGLWLALAATWAIVAVCHHMSRNRGAAAGFGLGMTAWEYARTQFGCITHYLRLVFWPSPLVLDYGRGTVHAAAAIVPSAIAVFVLMAATVTALVLRPRLGFLGAWFFAILAPSSSFVPLVGQTQAEHRMYLPLAAVVALVVLPAYRAAGRLGPRARRAMAVLVPVAAALLGWATHQRNTDYGSELAIWGANIRDYPLNYRAFMTRGAIHLANGQLDAALRDYDRCLALNSRNADAYVGRGNVYVGKSRYDQALKDYERAIELEPNLADGHVGRGVVLGFRGQVDAAMREFDRAIELNPELAEAHYNRANLYYARGALDAAIEGYDRVIGLRPDHARAYSSRGLARDNKGQIDFAIRDYDRAIELQPDLAEAYSNRCSAYDVKGQVDAAIKDCGRAIELRPAFAEAYSNRGNALQSKGQVEAAIRDYDRAIELRPDSLVAYQNRAIAHLRLGAMDQAWNDVKMVRKLGGTPVPKFLEELTRKSGRSEQAQP